MVDVAAVLRGEGGRGVDAGEGAGVGGGGVAE